jgi:LuxR family maltose regulon positive regulatory protein
MPRVPRHALIWSIDRTCYELFRGGQLLQRFRPGDDQAWLSWLEAQSACAFHGHTGRLNLHNEARTRRARYWYAYLATEQRSLKCYLGKTANLTLARLEQVAGELSGAHLPEPGAPHAPAPTSGAQMRAVVSDAARKAELRVVLLATKLAPPRVGATLVVRERLLMQLDGALSHRLTLLSAAAGYGKTTLLATWLSTKDEGRRMKDEVGGQSAHPSSFILHPFKVAWLSLDAVDNEQTRFWVALIGALRSCMPALG